MVSVPVTCALCESRCGLIAEVDQDQVRGLRPDRDHPISAGHACVKGLRFHELHHHQGRLRRPRLHGEETDWPRALGILGETLSRIANESGPQSIGIYSGNAAGHSLGAVLGVAAFQRGFGTRRHYSCLTLDNAPQFVVQEEVFGAAMRTFQADFAHADVIALFGTDPVSSQCSQAQSNPRGPHHIREAGRAGRLWVVDPRRSLTARIGHHLAPRPGSDVAVLGWLLREALPNAGASIPAAEIEGLRSAVEGFGLERVARSADLPPAALLGLRDALLGAERPLVWSGLGVLLSGQGTVGFWLTTCLQAVLGGIDRPGGWLRPSGLDLGWLSHRIGLRARDSSRRGRSGHPAILDTLPAADLAADALSGDLRALVVVGGNPRSALPASHTAAAALDALDLLIRIDLFDDPTADAALPACSWLARDDLPLHLAGRHQPESAVVRAVGQARPDFDILVGLTRSAGRKAFGSRVLDGVLRFADPVTWVRRLVPRIPEVPAPLSLHPDGMMHLVVPEFVHALEFPEPEGLALVSTIRPVGSLNHWIGQERVPTARVHPTTLADLGLGGGAARLVAAADGAERSVLVELIGDSDIRPGVVALPFGNAATNPNAVISAVDLEPFTGQPQSNGTTVRLVPVP